MTGGPAAPVRSPLKGTRTGKAARSGPTVPEHKRERQKKPLRMFPAESEALAQLAARWGVTESEAAARYPRSPRLGASPDRTRRSPSLQSQNSAGFPAFSEETYLFARL